MKVLQINCVYPTGSTGKITDALHCCLLSQGVESLVCYGRGPRRKEPDVRKLCPEGYAKWNNLASRVRGTMYGGCYLATAKLVRLIQKERPDVVHLQCINGYFVNHYRLLAFLKASGIPTVLTLHAEFPYTGNCGHAGKCDQWKEGCHACPRWRQETKSWFRDRTAQSWWRIHDCYRGWDALHVVGCSQWIAGRAAQSGGLKQRDITVIPNGIDAENTFYPHPGAGVRIRKRYKIPPEKRLILYVSPQFSYQKGFDLMQQLIRETEDLPFHYLLVGEGKPASTTRVTNVGNVTDAATLAELYSAADALVMCSRWENYPTVCLEATCCGTPVAGFDTGGVRETIPEGLGGTVPVGDIDALKALLRELTQAPPSSEAVKAARRRHSKEAMAEKYLQLYQEITENREKAP